MYYVGTLRKKYIDEKKSTRDVAIELGCSQATIMRELIRHNIPRRSYRENKLPTKKGGHHSLQHCKAISEGLKNSSYIRPRGKYNKKFKQIEVECSFCKKIILKKRYHLKYKDHFCSRKCHSNFKKGQNKGGKITVRCLECGKDIIIKRHLLKKKTYFFCSSTCQGERSSREFSGKKSWNFRGGFQRYYGESWRKARKEALKRDNYTCQHCGITKEKLGKNPDVHHLISFRLFGLERHEKANNLNNLITYCPRCHKNIECENNIALDAIDSDIIDCLYIVN